MNDLILLTINVFKHCIEWGSWQILVCLVASLGYDNCFIYCFWEGFFSLVVD